MTDRCEDSGGAADDEGAVDLNADLGEGYGVWSFNTDAELLAIVSSVNVACGFHAGDPTVIRVAVAAAHRNGVTIGAHVGYPDLQGFGRRNLDMGHQELVDATLYQLSALAGLARVEGAALRFVKPHGALYNRVVRDCRQADAVADAIALFDPALAVVSLPGSALHAAADDRGLQIVSEAFADRAYLSSGELAPRSRADALLHDPDQVAGRVLRMVQDHEVETVDGGLLQLRPDTVCVHGDSPGAVTMGKRLRGALQAAGVRIESPLAPRLRHHRRGN